MRVLGVHATTSTLWLACHDDDGPVDIAADFRLQLPAALESGNALNAARDDVQRILRRHDVTLVQLLSAEYSSRGNYTYQGLVPRITMETVVAFAAAAEGVEFMRVARPTLRTQLGLPTKGKLHEIGLDVVEKVSPHWGPNKRDLAAMAAKGGVEGGQ